MAGKKQFGIKEFKNAIVGCGGNKTEIARRLNCSRQTVMNYFEKYPELKQSFEHEDDVMLEIAESNALRLLNEGDAKMTMFVLETKGKNRGWSKRTEITGADGGALALSQETLLLLAKNGVEISDVVKQFEEMIKSQAQVLNGG